VEHLIDSQGYLKPYDTDQMIAYIEERPWPKQRKEETVEIVRKWKAGAKLRRPKEMTLKRNEIIPNQPDQVEDTVQDEDGAVASKTRPIMPRSEADLPSMALAVPLKRYLGGHRFWKDEGGEFVVVEDPSTCLDWMMSIDYQYMPRADALGAWFNRCKRYHGVHVAMHGDDNYTLVVDEDGSLTASGIDLSNCDKSCGEPMQNSFCSFANNVTDMTYVEEIALQRSLLTGEIEIKTTEDKSLPKIYWRKTKMSTNTGEPLTSVKAVFAQYPAIFVTIRACIISGKFRPHMYKLRVAEEWESLGLIPEFEEDQYGSVWHHPSAVTYLGGMFVELNPGTQSDWCWVSNKQLKGYFYFPDTAKIYGGKYHMQEHMTVLLVDPDLRSGPVGRALARWYGRVVFATFGSDMASVRHAAMAKYERHLMNEDRYKLEMRHEQGDYLAPEVSDEAYVHAAGYMLNRHDQFELRSDIMRICAEIDTFDTRPFQKLETSATALYVLRFGVPKRKTGQVIPDKDKDELIPELNFIGRLFNLSARIFQVFTKTDTDDEAKADQGTCAGQQATCEEGGQEDKDETQSDTQGPQRAGPLGDIWGKFWAAAFDAAEAGRHVEARADHSGEWEHGIFGPEVSLEPGIGGDFSSWIHGSGALHRVEVPEAFGPLCSYSFAFCDPGSAGGGGDCGGLQRRQHAPHGHESDRSDAFRGRWDPIQGVQLQREHADAEQGRSQVRASGDSSSLRRPSFVRRGEPLFCREWVQCQHADRQAGGDVPLRPLCPNLVEPGCGGSFRFDRSVVLRDRRGRRRYGRPVPDAVGSGNGQSILREHSGVDCATCGKLSGDHVCAQRIHGPCYSGSAATGEEREHSQHCARLSVHFGSDDRDDPSQCRPCFGKWNGRVHDGQPGRLFHGDQYCGWCDHVRASLEW